MKDKKIVCLIMSLLLVVAAIAPVIAYAEEKEGVKIVSTTPEDGSTGVAPMGLAMEVAFNSPMDPATLSTATISSEPAAISAVVPDKTNTSKCTIYFTALEINTKYKVMFSKQIKAASGERLQKAEVEFQTSAKYPQHHQIVNGDMENTAHLNMFELAGASKNVLSYQKEDENTILKFNPGWAGAGVGQYVYLEPGKTYEMRAKIKSTTSQMVRMIMSYVSLSEGASNWWHPIVSKTLPADQWVEFSGTVTIPEDLSYDHDRLIRITAQNKGQIIYIDDWQFFETGFDVPMPKTARAEEKQLETYISAEENNKIEQMVALGVFEADALEKADLTVTRLDAAVYMGRIAGVTETASLPTEFLDLDGVRKRDAAQALVDMGIMKGFGQYFYPDNNISVEEVLESTVNLLGYGPMAAKTGYTNAVINLKLSKDVKAKSGAITYSDFAKILANAMETDAMNNNGTVAKGNTLLWRNLKIKEMRGIVTETEYTDIYGVSKAQKGKIVIDGVSYKVTFDTYGLEGKRVKFFTKEINNENFILYITEINTLNNIINIDWKDIEKYSDSEYVYVNEKNKRKKVSLAHNKKLIYNGVALGDSETEDLAVYYGNVELIDNNLDNRYDVVRVENIDTYVVKAVDHANFIIYDEYETKVLDLKNAETIVVEENGEKAQFGNIIPGKVVSVVKSKDGSFAKLYISDKKIESTVGRIAGSGSDMTIVLYDYIHGDGASIKAPLHPSYTGTKDARENGSDFLGQNVVVLTDHMGYAVSVTYGVGVNNWQWGYIVDAYNGPKDFDEITEILLYDESGKFNVYNCAKKVNVNGKLEELSKVVSAINGGVDNVIPQVIRFRKNADDEITQILSVEDPEKRLTKVTGSGIYYSTLKTLGYKTTLSSTSIPVFAVPSDKDELKKEYKFVCSTASEYLANEKEYNFEAYSIDGNELNAELVVLIDRPTKSTDSWTLGMVMDIMQSMDESGEIRYEIAVQNTGSKYTAIVYPDRIDINNLSGINKEDTGLQVKIGDIVMYQNNPSGVVDNMSLLFSHSHRAPIVEGDAVVGYEEPAKKLYTSEKKKGYRSIFGTVKKRKGDLISIMPSGSTDEEKCEVYDLSAYSKVLVFDSARGKTYIGSRADVFENNEVVAVSNYGGATLMAVYK